MKEQIEKALEKTRQTWMKIAKEYNWWRDPFCIQLWAEIIDGKFIVNDSIYLTDGETEDLIILEGQHEHIELPKIRGVRYTGNPPKYLLEIGDEAIYFAGNWHYIVKGRGVVKGEIYYMLECNEEDCEHCPCEDVFLPEEELQTYEEYCDHDCNTCEHNTRKEYLACELTFEE